MDSALPIVATIIVALVLLGIGYCAWLLISGLRIKAETQAIERELTHHRMQNGDGVLRETLRGDTGNGLWPSPAQPSQPDSPEYRNPHPHARGSETIDARQGNPARGINGQPRDLPVKHEGFPD